MAACGYPGVEVGENIAAGYRSPASVMQAWLLSPGHRANIEAPGWKVIGIGVAQSARGTLLWVQDFGVADDSNTRQIAFRSPIPIVGRCGATTGWSFACSGTTTIRITTS